jgi:hypothetical protein
LTIPALMLKRSSRVIPGLPIVFVYQFLDLVDLSEAFTYGGFQQE